MSGTASPAPPRGGFWLSFGWAARYLAVPAGLVALLLLVEGAASLTGWIKRPSEFFGEVSGTHEAAQLRTQQAAEAERAKLVAEAQERGKLAAELELKAKVEATMQAVRVEYETRLQTALQELQRTTAAYQSLYERFNQLAQIGYGMERAIAEYQQRQAQAGMVGGAMAANVADFLCAFGSAESCTQAARVRQAQAQELAQIGRVGSILPRNPLSGIEDPATLRLRADQALQGRPVASPVPVAVPVPPPPPAGPARVLHAVTAKDRNPWSVRLQADGRAFFNFSNGESGWASYTEDRVNGEARFCFRPDKGGRECKLMRRQPDGSVGWVTEGQARPSSFIVRQEGP